MTVGVSVFLLAVGAILKFAVTDTVEGVDLGIIGVILMVCGVIGLLFGLIQMANQRRTGVPPYYQQPPY
jgi:TRAP-type C4-dicarboxylate transport system permease small subunit